jgi:hypothetical protein
MIFGYKILTGSIEQSKLDKSENGKRQKMVVVTNTKSILTFTVWNNLPFSIFYLPLSLLTGDE